MLHRCRTVKVYIPQKPSFRYKDACNNTEMITYSYDSQVLK